MPIDFDVPERQVGAQASNCRVPVLKAALVIDKIRCLMKPFLQAAYSFLQLIGWLCE
jgi:hypothetical protein